VLTPAAIEDSVKYSLRVKMCEATRITGTVCEVIKETDLNPRGETRGENLVMFPWA
jgi:hypothetical protein